MQDAKNWWEDTKATRHICEDKDLFIEYKIDHDEHLFLSTQRHLESKEFEKSFLNFILHLTVPTAFKNDVLSSTSTSKNNAF